jgi:DNA repair exonuclease SbcCD ATPase subunit
MRIKTVSLRGFKGLEREYEIGEATLLTGPNGSGKSACLEAIRYAIAGVVPAGKALDLVAEYFPARGGSVEVVGERGERLRRGIARDLEKAKVSEVLECEDAPAWSASPQVLDLREFTTLSAQKRREFILKLCGGGEAGLKVVMDTFAREYAKEVGGPGATPAILFEPGIGDLPEDLQPLASAWLSEVASLTGSFTEGGTTSELCLKLLESARVYKNLNRRAALDARAAIRELEAEAQGARAAAAELKGAKERVEDLTENLQAARTAAARSDEARRRVDAAREKSKKAEIAHAQALEDLRVTPAPGSAPTPPERDHGREAALREVSIAQQGLREVDMRRAEVNLRASDHARFLNEVRVTEGRIKRMKASNVGRVVGLIEEIPDAADPSMPALRAAVDAVALEWRADLQRLEEERKESEAKAQKPPAAVKALADMATEFAAASLRAEAAGDALEAFDEKLGLDDFQARDAAWRKVDRALRLAQEAAERARAAYRGAASAEGEADDRLAELPEPAASPDAIEADLYKAREILERAEKAAGALRAYENAIKLAESSEVLEEAWKRAEKALRRVQEALVGQATAPLVGDANRVLERAGRPERIYLELENDRGRPIFELGWIADGVRVSLDALSSGQAVLVSAALSIAIALRAKGLRLLLIEADPLDAENLAGLFPALRPWAEKLDALLVATAQAVPAKALKGWTVIRVPAGKEVAADAA